MQMSLGQMDKRIRDLEEQCKALEAGLYTIVEILVRVEKEVKKEEAAYDGN